MCGISGLVSKQGLGSAEMARLTQAMAAAIQHRGPDGEGVYADDYAGLGHRRLAILDLTDAAAQPMSSEDGRLVLIFNGEIYNYLELRAQLQRMGYAFRSTGDTEVVLRAYQAWGPDCVTRFNGMWGIALWDKNKRELFMSRDRLGVKPLFYVDRAQQLYFCSEIVGLRAVLNLHDANQAKLHDYLAYGYRTNNGQTFFDGVKELPPGHNLIWRDGQMVLSRYWQLKQERLNISAEEAQARLRELLEDAVRLRFRSDVPVALLQSGGIDSSIICSIVNDAIASGGLPSQGVTAYSAVFPGHAYDESNAINALMATCPHIHSVTLSADGGTLARDFGAYCKAMQEPMSSGASYMHWLLMEQLSKAGIKVVINGQGADEAFAGYGYYIRGYRLLDLALSRPGQALREMRQMRAEMGVGHASSLAQTAKAVVGRRAASLWRARFKEGTLDVLSPAFHSAHRGHLPDLGMVWGKGNMDRHLRGQLSDYGFNQILHYEDQSSMSRSVEIRSPFVDYRVMEFAFSLPDALKFSDGQTKRVLRQAYAGRIPDQIINNGKKLGFATPTADWMAAAPMQGFVRDLVNSADFRHRNLWRADRLSGKLTDSRHAQRGFPVWRYLMTAQWLQQNQIRNV